MTEPSFSYSISGAFSSSIISSCVRLRSEPSWLNAPDIEYEKDGSVILYYKNQSIDITHKFNKDNICYVKLVDGDDSLYVTVKYNNGYASSPNKYISPWEFI